MQNFIKIYQKVQEIGPVSLFFFFRQNFDQTYTHNASVLNEQFIHSLHWPKIMRSLISVNKKNIRPRYNTIGYRNDPKFSDRQAWANSADPDQTAPV